MYIDRDEISLYPFSGLFYRTKVDDTLPLDQQVEVKEEILRTECDITESSHSRLSDFIVCSFVVYFPFDKEQDIINVKNGDLFESSMYNRPVNGKVVGVFPSQLGGCVAYIQDTDE